MELLKPRRPRMRSVALLTAGILAGSVMLQPAVAHVTRRLNHLFRHLDPRYINVGEAARGSLSGNYPNPTIANDAVGSAQVTNNSLTGDDINDATLTDVQLKSETLFAVVSSAGSGAVLVRGRGATAVSSFFATTVTFNRNVSTCAWNATVDDGTASDDQVFAMARPGTANTDVLVTLYDDTGALELGETFYLVVIC
jgi:hypothetical protein